ncbi:MAG: hypothetical protein MUF44_00365 [Hydrogenophaga sp.]|nr:hypothetical protein [Hydrogenophaga sp.]
MNTKETNNSSSLQKLIFAFSLLILALISGLVLGNMYLNPMVYRTSHMQEVAQALAQGKNYGVYDTNINWRALRREQIKLMSETPQVVVSGGSRWQEASSIHTPGKTFFNAFGHSDFSEDFFAIVHLLEENGRMPETLVLSLRYSIFAPIADRDATGWREWVPEYEAMMAKLGLEPHSASETGRKNHWLALLSIKDLVSLAKRRLSSREHPHILNEEDSETLDVIRSDGSLQWSKKNANLFTPEYAEKDSIKRLARYTDYTLRIDADMVDATDRLFAYLKEKKVKVVLAQTPFHPTFYDGIKQRQYGQTLDEIEEIGRKFSLKYDFPIVGGFDPKEVGCPKEEFIDWHHGTPDCLAKIFSQIKF